MRSIDSWSRHSKWMAEEHMVVRMRLETDANTDKWGGCLWFHGAVHAVHGHFTDEQLLYRIHRKEVLAVLFTLRDLSCVIRDCVLDLYVDNEIVRFTLLQG